MILSNMPLPNSTTPLKLSEFECKSLKKSNKCLVIRAHLEVLVQTFSWLRDESKRMHATLWPTKVCWCAENDTHYIAAGLNTLANSHRSSSRKCVLMITISYWQHFPTGFGKHVKTVGQLYPAAHGLERWSVTDWRIPVNLFEHIHF